MNRTPKERARRLSVLMKHGVRLWSPECEGCLFDGNPGVVLETGKTVILLRRMLP